MEEHGITWGGLFLERLEYLMAFYGIDPVVGVNAIFLSLLLIVLAFFGGRKFRRGAMLEPQGRVSLSFLMELVVGKMLAFFDGIIEHGARKYFFLLGTFAFFILGSNLIGLVPGFSPPTGQLNVTVPLALTVFFTAHFLGIKTHGFAYFKKFLGPIWWLTPLMLPLELISHLVRPLSLSVRLFGNMTADHMVVLAFGTFVAPLFLPVPFMGLGVFVSFVQTFVFVLLASVYFREALEEGH